MVAKGKLRWKIDIEVAYPENNIKKLKYIEKCGLYSYNWLSL